MGPETRGAIPTTLARTWASRVQGLFNVSGVQEETGENRQHDDSRGDEVVSNSAIISITGQKSEPRNHPKSTERARKNKGRCQMFRVKPRGARAVETNKERKEKAQSGNDHSPGKEKITDRYLSVVEAR